MGAVNRAAAAGGSIAAVLGAASIAAVNLPQYEGWVLTGYGDPMQGSKLATACAGVTKGIELGKKYTEEDCQSRTAQALVERATSAGWRQMVAVIGDSENTGSIGLHLSLGFRQVGVFRSIGVKFGRWLDVVMMQKTLGEGDRTLPG